MKRHETVLGHKPRIRTYLIVTLTSFVTVGLLLLLVSQTVFLDDLYEFSKIRSVKTAVQEIAGAVGTDEFEDYAEYWSVKEDCEIYLVNAAGQILYSHGVSDGERNRPTAGEFLAFYASARAEQDGTFFYKSEIRLMEHNDKEIKPPKQQKPGGDIPPDGGVFVEAPSSKEESSERVLYAKIVSDEDNSAGVMAVVTSVLTPIGATVRTLQVQLVIAIVLFVALSVLLAWFVARIIASPIIDINHAAKRLASGDYVSPREGAYCEVAELRETLNVIDGELRKSEQLQRDLIANVSHDLRTPLTMIIGYSEAIRDLPGEDSAENIQVVIDEAERLSRLVSDVLDLSKLQSGTQRFDMAPLELTQLLRDTVLRFSRMMQQEGYCIELIADDDVTVSADEVRVSQIVYNLLSNALTHTGDDKRVEVRQTVCGDRVRVSFADSGKGIPEEELSNIWLRYYQVHSDERRRDTMNSGLGLSIVYALVQRHGGTCGVESVLGKGSTFWFELPLL